MSPLKPFQSRIIFLFVQQELLVAEIYRFFAGLFPETRDFWEGASREEMEHATWVEYFYKKTATDEVRFQEDKVKTYTVESFIKYLEDNLAKVKEKAPTQKEAFSIALSIENSMLVRRIFDHFQSSDPETDGLIRDLREKLKDHRKDIETRAASANGAPLKTR
jgi:rubrerythrin